MPAVPGKDSERTDSELGKDNAGFDNASEKDTSPSQANTLPEQSASVSEKNNESGSSTTQKQPESAKKERKVPNKLHLLTSVQSSPSLLQKFRTQFSTPEENPELAASTTKVSEQPSPSSSKEISDAKPPRKPLSVHRPLRKSNKSKSEFNFFSKRQPNGCQIHDSSSPKQNGAAPTTPSRRPSLPILSRLRGLRKDTSRQHPPNSDVIIVNSVTDSPSPYAETPPYSATRGKRFLFLQQPSQENGGGFKFPFPLPERLHRWITAESSIEGKEIRNTLVVGAAFQLVFTANYAIQNLQSSLHDEESLGASALGCMYATSIFSSIFAPTLIGIFGAKGCLVLAWICHLLYTMAQFHPHWGTLVPASILLGLITGPIWTAQGLYVSACAFSFSKRSTHSPYTILSRFNGLFFTLYETKNILGNLVSSFVLRDGISNQNEDVIFQFCGPDDCPDGENVTEINEPEGWVVDTMLGIYMALQVIGLVITIALVTPLARSEWVTKISLRETATSWFHTLIGTEMLFLVPFMIFQSMQQAILLTEYTRSYVSCPIGIHKVGFVMAAYGAVTAIFVMIFSRLARLTGRYPLFALAASVNAALLGVLLNWTPDLTDEGLIFIFPVAWGVSEAIWQTQTNSMLAVIFSDSKEPAFANYQTWRAVGYTLTFSYHSFLCVSTKLAIALGFLVVGMIFYTAVELRIRWKDRIRIPKPGAEDPMSANRKSTSPPRTKSASSTDKFSEITEKVDAKGNSMKKSASATVISLGSVSTDVSGSEVKIKRSRPPSQYSFTLEEELSTGSGSQATLNGLYLSRGESAYLDNDLRKYGVIPTEGSRPIRVSQFARSISEKTAPRSPSTPPASPNLRHVQRARPYSWHERHQDFRNEGDLKIRWEKDDVYVF